MSTNNITAEVNKSNSIEWRLMLIMSLFVTLFICATLTGWALSNTLRQSQEILIQSAMPSLKHAQNRISNTLQLVDLSIRLSSPQSLSNLTKLERQIPAETINLGNDSSSAKSPIHLISTNLTNQIHIQKKIITLTDSLIEKKQLALDKTDAMLLDVRSIFSEAALKNLSYPDEGKEHHEQKRLDREIQSLTEMRFEIQAIRSIITAITPDIGVEQGALLKQHYQSILNSLSLKLPDLKHSNKIKMAAGITEIYDTLNNSDSLFLYASSIAINQHNLSAISATSIHYAETQQKQALDQYQKATKDVERHQEQVRRLMSFSLYFWAALAFIAIAFSFIVVIFYIKPQIIQRLRRITNDTKMIADGNYDIAISLDGKDEITLIAASLEQFRNQLIAKECIQNNLAEREAFLYSIYQYANDGLFTLDKNGSILSTNRSFETIFSANKKELSNISIEPFFPDIKITEKLIKSEQQNSVTGDTIVANLECTASKKDGSTFYANISIGVIMPGKTRLFSCFIRDITEQKQAKEKLNMAIEELTESNGELERFASSCSHDLQEPMRMVATFSERLTTHLNESEHINIDAKTKKYLKFINDGSNNAKQLITGILQYSRLGQQGLEKKEVDLDNLFSRVHNLIEALIIEKSASLTWNANDIKIYGMESPLFQLFLNLVTNGIKFNCSATPSVHIHAETQGHDCIITIQDNGIGINPKYHEQIFDIFKRLNSKREFDGSGIGLALCSKIVKKSGGRIWLESDESQGSCFYISLPTNIKR